MNRIPHFLITCSILLLFSLQTNAENIEVFSVTGSHVKQTNVPKITLLADDIKALAANNFADVLRGLPGIDISQQGGSSGLTFLSIRGGDPNFVTILIDGVKVNDPTNSRGGAFDLGTIDPNIIEKIEIFYGSFSTVYGSDALSGVLSIQTKQAEDDLAISTSIKAGSHGVKGASIHVSAPVTFANFSLSGSLQDDDSSNFGDAFMRKELISSFKSAETKNTRWRVSGFYAEGEGKYFSEDSGGDRLSVIRFPESRKYKQLNIATKMHHPFNEMVNLTVEGATTTRKESVNSPGIAQGVLDAVPPIVSDTNYKRKDVASTVNYQLSDYLSSAFGIALIKEIGRMQSTIDFGVLIDANYQLERQTKSAYTELKFQPSQVASIIVGVRRDNTKLLNVSTKRMLASVQVLQNIKLSTQYSEGFKLPSFFALGHPLVGNAELQPERSENIEVSFDQNSMEKDWSTRLSIYQNTYIDLVDFDPELFTNVNRSKVRVRGAELSSSYDFNHNLSLMAQISYTNINTYDPNINLRRRPKYKGSIKASYYVMPSLNFTVRFTKNASYFDSSVPTGAIELDGFNQFDVSALWRTKGQFDWRLQLNNVLDSKHEEALGFSNAGTTIILNVAKRFY